MQYYHHKPHHKVSIFEEMWIRKVPFLVAFLIVLGTTFAVLYLFDFYPEYKSATTATTTAPVVVKPTPIPAKPVSTTTDAVKSGDIYPVKVTIEALDKTVTVLNPDKSDVATLDNALLSGVIRYPGSATYAKPGTMVLLGHSSYLPTVHNKNFQAFNGIQKLEWGDIIRVETKGTEYIYRVQKVREAKASTAEVDLQWKNFELTLVTCNSFGSKEDRFIVEAYLISQKPLK